MTEDHRRVFNFDTQSTELKDIHDVFRFGTESRESWWRGQPEKSPLVAGVFRRAYHEQNLTLQFRSRAPVRHGHCPSHDDFPAWLFFMQHYRLRTRLLDWTESILVATFFAVAGAPSELGELWGLNPTRLNETQFDRNHILIPESAHMAPIFEGAFKTRELSDKVAAVGVREIDMRMMVQQSAFTIHDTRMPLEQFPESSTFLKRATISHDAKTLIRLQLQQIGVRRHHLFPDLETLAMELNNDTPP